jgi:serine/threonine protein kinase
LAKNHERPYWPHTYYVSTRWYRAPEIMLRFTNYDCKVDMFAFGCIMAELYTGQPLFPGISESDMLVRYGKTMGDMPADWRKGQEAFK